MDPALASFAAQARRLRQLSGLGFSFEEVEVPSFPLKNRVTAHNWRSTTSFRCLSRRSRRRRIDLGPQIARLSAMLNLSAANLIGGFVFGSIGFVAFIYGKRMNLWRPMLLGIGLMVYPYFINNDLLMIAIGTIGTAGLFFLR